jgi:hypothetical protein
LNLPDDAASHGEKEVIPVEYRISMTRSTYDALVRYMTCWSTLYALPGVECVLAGSVRKSALPKGKLTGFIVGDVGISSAKCLAKRFAGALHGLGRAHATKTVVKIDLRDLLEAEIDSLILLARIANLKGMQRKALERIETSIREFKQLPPLVRLACMAAD